MGQLVCSVCGLVLNVLCGITLPMSVCYRHGSSLLVLYSSGGVGLKFFIPPIMSSHWLLWLALQRGKGLLIM